MSFVHHTIDATQSSLLQALAAQLLEEETCVTSGEMVLVGVLEWPLWCLKLVKATIMLTMVEDFSNNLLSNCHMSRNVNAWPERLCENPRTPVKTCIMRVMDETELPQQPSQTSGKENTVALVSPSDVPMPDPVPPETPDENAETSNDDRENTAEPVPHSSSSHWEWRPECEVPPPEPGDSAVTRRRVVAKRPPTVDEEEEMRQKRLRSEPVPELFPLTGEELSENVFEILIDLFASPGSEHCEDSRLSAG